MQFAIAEGGTGNWQGEEKLGLVRGRERILYVWLLSGFGYASVLNDMVLEQMLLKHRVIEVGCYSILREQRSEMASA